MISLMLLLYQLSAGIGSVLPISNNLPFPSPQLIWTFYWYNCCFLSYSSFKGHWRVNLQVSSLPCYYSETSICESHLNSQNKTTQLFTLLIKENKAKVSQPVNQQPLDWIWAGSIQTKASLFYTCLEPSNPRTATLNNLIKSKLSILWTHHGLFLTIVSLEILYDWCLDLWIRYWKKHSNISVHSQKRMQ